MDRPRPTLRYLVAAWSGMIVACVSLVSAAPALARAPHHDRKHAPAPLAHAAIVNGGPIPITAAPWQVAIRAEISPELELLCGGSIVNETTIVTAGHCLFDPPTPSEPSAETQVLSTDVTVYAGTANINEGEYGPAVQKRSLSALHAHPYYKFAEGPGTPDDVAVLTLSSPLQFNASIQPIPLVAANEAPPGGALATMTGFGQQDSGLPDGLLYSLQTSIFYSGECGRENDALFLCTRTASGSACFGDSGGGLSTGTPATLVGVVDIVEVVNENCVAGAFNGFVNVAAPEIRDFIEDPLNANPPLAPRGGLGIKVRAIPQVGHPVTCEAGSWSGTPTFTYGFLDSRNGQTLQSGPSSSYTLTASDVGRTIYCEVHASNAGGTGYQRTTSLRAVEPATQSPSTLAGGGSAAPKPGATPAVSHLSLLGAKIAVRHGGQARVMLECTGNANCTGKLSLTAREPKQGRRAAHTVQIGSASVIIAAGSTIVLTVKLNGHGRSLLSKDDGHLTAKLKIAVRGQASRGYVVHLHVVR